MGIDIDKLQRSIKACAHHPEHDCNNCEYSDDKLWCYNDELLSDFDKVIESFKLKKEGHWIVLTMCANEGIYCSECHMKIFDFITKPKDKLSRYCPHCGSKNVQFFKDGEVVFR